MRVPFAYEHSDVLKNFLILLSNQIWLLPVDRISDASMLITKKHEKIPKNLST